MATTWILVADASRASLYQAEKRGAQWTLVRSFAHADSRVKSSRLSPTEPGHAQQSKGGEHHTAFEPVTSPHEAEAMHFAEELIEALAVGCERGACQRLVLVAPPHFLGLLRKGLPRQVEKHLATTVNKDYTALATGDLSEQLDSVVFSGPDH